MTGAEITAKRRGAATWLAEQGFAIVHIPQGRKAPDGGLHWQKRAVTDPGMAGALIKGEADQFGAFPLKGSRLLVIDQDVPGKLEELGVEIPETLRVRTSVKDKATGWRGQHVYLRLAAGVDEKDVPRSWDGGEVRLAGSGQVVGPWSTHPDGLLYEPVNGVRAIGTATRELVDALRASKNRMRSREDTAAGPEDAGWYMEQGRHEHLVERGRWLRGNGLTGERLRDELVRLDQDRHRPPIADIPERGVKEIEGIVEWLMKEIADDSPGVTLAGVTEHAPGKAPLRFYTPREVAALTLPTPDWLIPGLLAVSAITEIDGKIKAAGKTTLALYAARAVLDGEPFLGFRTRQARVLYVTQQQRQTFMDALRRVGLADRGDEIRVLFREDLRGMRWPEVVALVREEAVTGNRELVVVDTIGKLSGIVEENDAGAWSAAMTPVQDLAASGRAVLLARHDRKSGGEVGESGRGSSQASGDVDIILALRRPEGNQPSSRRVIESLSRYPDTPEKNVDELHADGYQLLGSAEAVSASDGLVFVLASLGGEFRQHEGETQKELVAEGAERAPRVERWAIRRALDELIAEGQVTTTGKARSSKDPLRYHLLREGSGVGVTTPNRVPPTLNPTPSPDGHDGRQEQLFAEILRVTGAELVYEVPA